PEVTRTFTFSRELIRTISICSLTVAMVSRAAREKTPTSPTTSPPRTLTEAHRGIPHQGPRRQRQRRLLRHRRGGRGGRTAAARAPGAQDHLARPGAATAPAVSGAAAADRGLQPAAGLAPRGGTLAGRGAGGVGAEGVERRHQANARP